MNSRFNYSVYDGEWKGGGEKPNGAGKSIVIYENYGIYGNDNGYAMIKTITDGIYIHGRAGTYEKIFEWDIDDILPWGPKDIREYKGSTDQTGRNIEEYVKKNGEWKKLDISSESYELVIGFGGEEEDFNWCSYLQRGED